MPAAKTKKTPARAKSAAKKTPAVKATKSSIHLPKSISNAIDKATKMEKNAVANIMKAEKQVEAAAKKLKKQATAATKKAAKKAKDLLNKEKANMAKAKSAVKAATTELKKHTAEANVELNIEEYEAKLYDKASADLSKAVDKFEKQWRAKRAKADAVKIKAFVKKENAKLKMKISALEGKPAKKRARKPKAKTPAVPTPPAA